MNRIINKYVMYVLVLMVSVIILLLTLAVIDKSTKEKALVSGVGGKINESRLLGKELPPFTIYNRDDLDENIESVVQEVVFDKASLMGGLGRGYEGRGGMINFFASWCIPCVLEHPFLTELNQSGLDIYGIVFNDTAFEVEKFLAKYGDPYKSYGFDPKGRAVVEFGLTGVPQSYLFNKEGKIVYVMIGPITKEVLEDNILPLIREF